MNNKRMTWNQENIDKLRELKARNLFHKIVGRIPTDLSVGGSPLPPSIGCVRGKFKL